MSERVETATGREIFMRRQCKASRLIFIVTPDYLPRDVQASWRLRLARIETRFASGGEPWWARIADATDYRGLDLSAGPKRMLRQAIESHLLPALTERGFQVVPLTGGDAKSRELRISFPCGRHRRVSPDGEYQMVEVQID